MEERNGDHRRFRKYRKAVSITGCILLVLALSVVGFNLTEAKDQKAQKISSEKVKAENKDYKTQEGNPLKLNEDPQVTAAVKDYYLLLADGADFAESYDDVQVYTKLGKYKDSYVAFVTYGMKIKDIYTKVPGLGSIYVEKDAKSGKYHVSPEVAEEELKADISQIAEHEDVKELMRQVQTQYQAAVDSDALLKEALLDLKNAYEDSTGTSSNE